MLAQIARSRTSVVLGLAALAVALRVLAVAYSPTPFGYVYDYYHEAIELFWRAGRLPVASDCWQCYHPPLFYLLGLPFYAIGRWITAGADSSPEWGLRFSYSAAARGGGRHCVLQRKARGPPGG